MKFLVSNYSCLQNPWLGGYQPQIPILSVLNWICSNPPPPEKKFLGTPLVTIVTRLLASKSGGLHPGKRERCFPSPNRPSSFWGPIFLLFSGYQVLVFFLGSKATGAWNWSLASIHCDEVKKEWSYTTTPPLRHLEAGRDRFI